jgi:DNA-binding NtrC family response regulator
MDSKVNTFEVTEILPLDEVVNKYIKFAITANGGAKDSTARLLKIDRKTLYKRCKQIGVRTIKK